MPGLPPKASRSSGYSTSECGEQLNKRNYNHPTMKTSPRPSPVWCTPGAIALLPVPFTSCSKCETCTYEVTDVHGNRTTQPFREICGKKHQRDGDRQACESMAALNGSTCVCSTN